MNVPKIGRKDVRLTDGFVHDKLEMGKNFCKLTFALNGY
jgi:hypothetical protein